MENQEPAISTKAKNAQQELRSTFSYLSTNTNTIFKTIPVYSKQYSREVYQNPNYFPVIIISKIRLRLGKS